ncbi:MAG: hypothetical protein IAG13_02110 [Deltaproteobacteria bacterium]|nr:hypothetical protein [Nannocystaceae bacterium]
MTNLRNGLLRMSLCCLVGVGVAVGCEKKETSSPGDDSKSTNLCTDYATCDECIAGQQKTGISEGEAETQCGAAVLGCWTTWDKPIVCGDKTHDEKPAG